MSNQSNLAVHQNQPITINAAPSLIDTMKIAEIFYKARIVKSIESEAQACAKILAGQEMGLGPMASLSQIHLVDGRPTMDATLVGAQIKKSGRYDYRVKRSDKDSCVLEFFERGESVGLSEFTMDEARTAGLANKAVWKSYAKAMLRSRAMTQGARMYCPDVFNGAVYTSEELGAEVEVDNNGTMKVVSAEKTVLESSRSENQPAQLSADDAERVALIKQIYKMVWVDPAITGPEKHQFRRKTVADDIGLSPVPQNWADFTLLQLREFTSAPETDVSTRCEYCPNTDGTHREDCPDHPDAADHLADKYEADAS